MLNASENNQNQTRMRKTMRSSHTYIIHAPVEASEESGSTKSMRDRYTYTYTIRSGARRKRERETKLRYSQPGREDRRARTTSPLSLSGERQDEKNIAIEGYRTEGEMNQIGTANEAGGREKETVREMEGKTSEKFRKVMRFGGSSFHYASKRCFRFCVKN